MIHPDLLSQAALLVQEVERICGLVFLASSGVRLLLVRLLKDFFPLSARGKIKQTWSQDDVAKPSISCVKFFSIH